MADDERWITIDGRRWRRTDPGIPEGFRVELVAELMEARRAVGGARRQDDEAAEASARRRVHDAKVALGERGPTWWDELEPAARRPRVEATIRALLRHRTGKTICPSDVARTIGGSQWRSLLPLVREVAGTMVAGHQLRITQKGADVPDPTDLRGPVRFVLPAADPPTTADSVAE